MKVGQFAEILALAEAIYADAGAEDKRRALEDFVALFSGYDDMTVAAFSSLVGRMQRGRVS
jgi:hypothetical protein